MRKRVNLVLAAVFCISVLLVCAMTLITSGRNFAYGFFKSYTDQLPRDPDVFDNVKARIYKLEYNAENRLWGRDPLRHLSARTQMLPGKELINIAGYDMVKLNSGGYYNVVSDPYDEKTVREFIDFGEKLKEEGRGVLLVYCHTALYEDGLLSPGAEEYDSNNEYADRLIDEFSSRGVTVVDSRESYRQSGLTLDEAVNRSDVHWTHRLALCTAHDALEAMNGRLGYKDIDAEKLDMENFPLDEYYPKRLSGEFARRVGDSLVEADDVYVLWPDYETHIAYEVPDRENSYKEGSFREAAICEENLEPDRGKTYSSNAYYIYGHYLDLTHTHNEGAGNDLTLLVFKDSYGAPLSIFLGLGARDVYAVDTRSYKDKTMQDWVDEYDPDIVIFAYCEQTFRKIDTVIED